MKFIAYLTVEQGTKLMLKGALLQILLNSFHLELTRLG